jgi:hypothetical protein
LSHVTGDLLSASSFLVAAVGMLYSTWFSEIEGAANTSIPDFDRDSLQKSTTMTLNTRAYPMLAAASIFLLLLLPPVISIITATAKHIFGDGAIGHYDAIHACFIAVYLVTLVLSATIGVATIRLRRHLWRVKTAVAGQQRD